MVGTVSRSEAAAARLAEAARTATWHDAGVSAADLIVVATAVLAASFVQVIAGFGFALLAMPVMTLAIPVEQAVVISTLLGAITNAWQSFHQRAHADRLLVRRLAVGAYVGMPLGLVVLNVVADRPLRIVLGVCVLIAAGLLVRRMSLAHVGPGLDYPCGFLSGVLNTSLGTSGPPLVFDLQARHLDPDRFRATIVAVFTVSNVLALALFITDGKITGDGMRAAALSVPAWVVGQAIGWPVRRHVHGERFRWLVLGLLFAAGGTAIVFAVA
jgi:uncharacterized membrane protein YfcA